MWRQGRLRRNGSHKIFNDKTNINRNPFSRVINLAKKSETFGTSFADHTSPDRTRKPVIPQQSQEPQITTKEPQRMLFIHLRFDWMQTKTKSVGCSDIEMLLEPDLAWTQRFLKGLSKHRDENSRFSACHAARRQKPFMCSIPLTFPHRFLITVSLFVQIKLKLMPVAWKLPTT